MYEIFAAYHREEYAFLHKGLGLSQQAILCLGAGVP